MGAGPGPEALPNQPKELREEILDYLAREYQNADAREMLSEIMNARAQQEMIRMPEPQVPATAVEPEEPIEAPLGDEKDVLADSGDISDYSLEEEEVPEESEYNPEVSLGRGVAEEMPPEVPPEEA